MNIQKPEDAIYNVSKDWLTSDLQDDDVLNFFRNAAQAVTSAIPTFINKDNNPFPSKNFDDFFALGGEANNNTMNVNAEGGEVVENPDGSAAEIKGPKHEQGGVPLNVENGTQFFSDRLTIGGKTIAERKKERLKAIERVKKKLEKNPKDTVLKNTLKRLIEIDKVESAKEMKFQEMAKKALYGDSQQMPSQQGEEEENPQEQQENQNVPQFGLGGKVTFGDILGLGYQIASYNNIGKYTKENRAGDTKRKNTFRNIEDKAVNKLESTKSSIDQNRDYLINKSRSILNQLYGKVNNSARSVNTLRALNLGVASKGLDNQNNIGMQSLRQKSAIDSKIANLIFSGDVREASAERVNDEADRADRDNYYTQLAKDTMNKLYAGQVISKSVNDIQERNIKAKELNSLYKNVGLNVLTGEMGVNTDAYNLAKNFRSVILTNPADRQKLFSFLGITEKDFNSLSEEQQNNLIFKYIIQKNN